LQPLGDGLDANSNKVWNIKYIMSCKNPYRLFHLRYILWVLRPSPSSVKWTSLVENMVKKNRSLRRRFPITVLLTTLICSH
jgi:hypothetical protein